MEKNTHATQQLTELRQALSTKRTIAIGCTVINKITGEILGEYLYQEYAPEPYSPMPEPNTRYSAFVITDDGTPLEISTPTAIADSIAPVFTLPLQERKQENSEQPQVGRKPLVTYNPIAPALSMLSIEGKSMQWLDDYIHGAIAMGPGVINGKLSVSAADVKKLLFLSALSVSTAAEKLLNHDHEPMSERQLQRVVQAARIALRGIALYLQRNPKILLSVDMSIDFEQLWPRKELQPEQKSNAKPIQRQRALEMRQQGIPIKTAARELGVSKNTIKRWEQESIAA